MSESRDWNKIQIQTLIVERINTFNRRGKLLVERGEKAKGNNLLQIAAHWEGLLNQFTAAEIRWPESGGEGS